MDDQLRAAGLIEETFHDQCLLRGQGAEDLTRTGQVVEQLFSTVHTEANLLPQPGERVLHLAARLAQAPINFALQTGDCERQFIAAPRCFAQPEGNARRQALGILDTHLAAFHAQNAIRGIAQLEDVAGDAFHGKVFVDAADVQALGFEQHRIVGVVGNGAAAG
ncbi:hypothetical protein D3C79_741590 [compost metagenome]